MITGTRACNMTVHPEYVTKKEGETATLHCNANMSISRNTSANVTATTSVGANTSVIASTSASVSTKSVSARVSPGVSASGYTGVFIGMHVSTNVSAKSVSPSVSASLSTKSVSASVSVSVSASSSTSVSTTSVNASCSQSAPTINCAWKVSWTPSNRHSRISFGACYESLTIKNVNRTDSGVYRCEARDNCGRVIFDNAVTLDVLCKYSVFYFH